jgi:hypothetical protein
MLQRRPGKCPNLFSACYMMHVQRPKESIALSNASINRAGFVSKHYVTGGLKGVFPKEHDVFGRTNLDSTIPTGYLIKPSDSH